MTPSAVLEAVHGRSRLITADDLGVLFDVSPRTIGVRARRGELPPPLSKHPLRWSAQQIARLLDEGINKGETS